DTIEAGTNAPWERIENAATARIDATRVSPSRIRFPSAKEGTNHSPATSATPLTAKNGPSEPNPSAVDRIGGCNARKIAAVTLPRRDRQLRASTYALPAKTASE